MEEEAKAVIFAEMKGDKVQAKAQGNGGDILYLFRCICTSIYGDIMKTETWIDIPITKKEEAVNKLMMEMVGAGIQMWKDRK